MTEIEKEPQNFVQVDLKKSTSSGGGLGFDIKVRVGEKATQEQMDKIAQIAFSTAFKVQIMVSQKGF